VALIGRQGQPRATFASSLFQFRLALAPPARSAARVSILNNGKRAVLRACTIYDGPVAYASPGSGMLRWGLWLHLAVTALIGTMAYLGRIPVWRVLAWPYADKAMHFLLVGGIAFWMVGGWGDRRLRLGALRVPLAVSGPLLLATLEELAQAFSPRRNADILDLAADAAGLLTFWWLARTLVRGRSQGESDSDLERRSIKGP